MNRILKNILLTPCNILYQISPRKEIELMFRLKQGYSLDLENVKTYNEKIQWIKLYGRHKDMPRCVDKYTVRKYVEEQGCKEILNELIWEGFCPEDIPFDSLPERCVIKATHGQGMNLICKDTETLDRDKTVKILKRWLKEKYLPCYGEWFYGVIPPRIIIERFLGDEAGNEPVDYKVFCFNGKAKLIDVHTGRFSPEGHKRNFYDMDWNLLRGVGIKYLSDEDTILSKPEQFDKMIEYAEKLSKPFAHVRVDFYLVGGRVYFGEMTFTNGAGFDRVRPKKFDLQLGEWICLPG